MKRKYFMYLNEINDQYGLWLWFTERALEPFIRVSLWWRNKNELEKQAYRNGLFYAGGAIIGATVVAIVRLLAI